MGCDSSIDPEDGEDLVSCQCRQIFSSRSYHFLIDATGFKSRSITLTVASASSSFQPLGVDTRGQVMKIEQSLNVADNA